MGSSLTVCWAGLAATGAGAATGDPGLAPAPLAPATVGLAEGVTGIVGLRRTGVPEVAAGVRCAAGAADAAVDAAGTTWRSAGESEGNEIDGERGVLDAEVDGAMIEGVSVPSNFGVIGNNTVPDGTVFALVSAPYAGN